MPRRRELLLQAGALLLAAPLPRAHAAAHTRLAAAWDDAEGRHHAGLIEMRDTLRVVDHLELPTRAHGLWLEPGGSLLVVARRPGDWLLRWRPGAAPQWRWSEPERRYSGHVIAAHGRLYTTEADLDSGAARVVVREARSLEVLDDWPSHGIDAHQLIADADGSLLVANGGVPTLPETGRLKLDRAGMDPSLVRLDARTGALRGQWRLPDPRLSIRHLARHAGGTVGVALQSEHDEPERRATAPLLALFDGRALRLAAPAPLALEGYSGDIAADAEGFVLAATRAGRLARWSHDGGWRDATPLADACPLALHDGSVWAGGSAAIVQQSATRARSRDTAALRLDNHWVGWERVSAPAASGSPHTDRRVRPAA